jgi:hypothetical protein
MALITLTCLNNHRSQYHNSSLGAVLDPCLYQGSSFLVPIWWISLRISEHTLMLLTESVVPEFGHYLVIYVLNLTVLIWMEPGIDAGWLAVCISVCIRSVHHVHHSVTDRSNSLTCSRYFGIPQADMFLILYVVLGWYLLLWSCLCYSACGGLIHGKMEVWERY